MPLDGSAAAALTQPWWIKDGATLGGELADLVKSYIVRELATRDARIEALEREVDDLREAGAEALRYTGSFNRATCYQRGAVCTHGGLLWFCCKPTVASQPGNSPDWLLMTKHNTAQPDANRAVTAVVGRK
jgi:hypothetical protein